MGCRPVAVVIMHVHEHDNSNRISTVIAEFSISALLI